MSLTRTPPPVYRPAQRPLKQSLAKPAAPPVYRPNHHPPILRSTPSLLLNEKETRPAPPVYRPNPSGGQAPSLQRKAPSPPPVYRPGATVQNAAKVNAGPARQAPPPVYRPTRSANVKPGAVQRKQTYPAVYRPGHIQLAAQPAIASRTGATTARTAGQTVVQPYFIIPPEKIFTDRKSAQEAERPAALISGTGIFPGQVMKQTSFVNSEGTPNIEAPGALALRVSDDCEMAIEDSNLKSRQPKTFFASQAALSTAMAARKGADFSLQPGNSSLTIWDKKGTEKTLTSVYPQSTRSAVDQPFDLKTPQACDEMAQGVSGVAYTTMVPTCKRDISVQNVTVKSDVAVAVAELVAALAETGEGKGVRELNLTTNLEKKRTIVAQVAQEYVSAVQQGGNVLEQHLRNLKLNQFADPDIGETYFIASVALPNDQSEVVNISPSRKFQPKWPYHLATVVAKSNTDTVTLENYARVAEGSSDTSAQDPRWYFQMYGKNQGQSFHEAWEASGEFANPVTMTMQPGKEWLKGEERSELLSKARDEDKRELQARALAARKKQEQELQAQAAQAAFYRQVKILGITVGVGLLAVTLTVLHRYGILPDFNWRG